MLLPWFQDRFPLYLAPMAGVTDTIFRQLVKEFGADVVVTEFVSAEGIFRKNERTMEYLDFADAENHVIRRYAPKTGLITRVAGTGKKGTAGLGGSPLECELARPHGVTVAKDGTLFITDSYNDRILKIVP